LQRQVWHAQYPRHAGGCAGPCVAAGDMAWLQRGSRSSHANAPATTFGCCTRVPCSQYLVVLAPDSSTLKHCAGGCSTVSRVHDARPSQQAAARACGAQRTTRVSSCCLGRQRCRQGQLALVPQPRARDSRGGHQCSSGERCSVHTTAARKPKL
jgi:hypothetical protein